MRCVRRLCPSTNWVPGVEFALKSCCLCKVDSGQNRAEAGRLESLSSAPGQTPGTIDFVLSCSRLKKLLFVIMRKLSKWPCPEVSRGGQWEPGSPPGEEHPCLCSEPASAPPFPPPDVSAALLLKKGRGCLGGRGARHRREVGRAGLVNCGPEGCPPGAPRCLARGSGCRGPHSPPLAGPHPV